MLKSLRFHLPPLAFLALVHLAAFGRLIFRTPEGTPHAMIPWDFASQCYPWQVYVGDSIHAGTFPLWAPYVGAGSPFFINPQSQLYSPVTLLVGTLWGYTQYSAQLHAVLSLLFGGIGAYLLSYELWRTRSAGLVSGLGFALTSAVFGNLQHMTTTNSDVLMPWLFWTTAVAIRHSRTWALPLLSFFIYFLITSGYPTIIAMTLLWVGAYTLFELQQRPARPWRERAKELAKLAGAWGMGLGLAAVHWIPIGLHSKEITRGAPMPAEAVLEQAGHLTFKSLWGVLFQFMTVLPIPGREPDISMRGIYFGVVAAALALVAVLHLKDRIVTALAVFTGGAFLMACGSVFFGRVALHLSIPAFNLSRFPASDSRALAVLGAVVLAGAGARLISVDHPGASLTLRRVLTWSLGLLAAGLFLLRELLPVEEFTTVALVFATAELAFVGCALLVVSARNGRGAMIGLSVLLALELGTSVLANTRAFAHKVSVPDYRYIRGQHQRAFTTDNVDKPREYDGQPLSEESRWGFVSKSFYLSDYNPMRLRRSVTLAERGFTEWLRTGKRVVALPEGVDPGSAEDFQKAMRAVDYRIARYEPNRVDYELTLTEPATVVFNELYFPGWRVSVDGGKSQRMTEVAGGLRAIRLPAGKHQLVTSFVPRTFYAALAVSLAFALAWLVWMGRALLRRRKQEPPFSEAPAAPAVPLGLGRTGS